jgi:enamine deaminase RidA (YjgF/YER057c/UK114 family)
MPNPVTFSNPPQLSKPMGYSHVADTHGRIIFISGQVPQDVNGALVGKDDFAAQVTQVFENLKVAIESVGGTFGNIAKLTCFVSDRVAATELPVFREIRDRYVNGQSPPASSLVFISRLVRPEWMIEVEAMAVIGHE